MHSLFAFPTQVPSGLLCGLFAALILQARAFSGVSFRNDVMAVLSKAGCNAGQCHGNANGKAGFKLSLRGEDPEWDFNTLTRDMSGRRANPEEASQSLILLKPTTRIAHEGGQRFTKDSPEYAILQQWIAAGMPTDPPTTPALERLEVSPTDEILFEPASEIQLHATAFFSDGSSRDVTRMAVFDSANGLVKVTHDGLVQRQSAGQTTVLVRYLQAQVPVRLAFMPARPDFVWKSPPENNYIDEQVFTGLRTLRINPSDLCTDTEFIRRAYLDLLGLLPTAEEARAFVNDERKSKETLALTPALSPRRGSIHRNPLASSTLSAPAPRGQDLPQRLQKRARLIDRLLERPEFADFWALKWSDILRNEEKVLDRKGIQVFHDWIRQSIAEHKPVDRFVREILSARGSTYRNPPANFYRANRDAVARAEATAQLFLGARLQCARCHNHPFDRWTMADYYDWADVFSRVQYKVLENHRRDGLDTHEFNGEQIVFLAHEGSLTNPRTGKPAQSRFLGESRPLPGRPLDATTRSPVKKPPGEGTGPTRHADLRGNLVGRVPPRGEPDLFQQAARGNEQPTPDPSQEGNRRRPSARLLSGAGGDGDAADELETLAAWVTRQPLFAKSQVNWIWFHLLGRGIVDPIDDFRITNPPSHPALLEALARDFSAHQFDLRHMIRTIMNSRTYQLSSEPTDTNAQDEINFSRAAPRRLSAEQLLDAQHQVLGVLPRFNGFPQGLRATQLPGGSPVRRADLKDSGAEKFLAMFGKPSRLLACECERSSETTLGQTFQLISSPAIHELLADPTNRLAALLDSGMTDAGIINELYWTALSRAPSPGELAAATRLLGRAGDKRAALEDVTWALLNAKEFVLRK